MLFYFFLALLLFPPDLLRRHTSAKKKDVDHDIENKQCSAIHAWRHQLPIINTPQKARVKDLRIFGTIEWECLNSV